MSGDIAALMRATRLFWRNLLIPLISSCIDTRLVFSCLLLLVSAVRVAVIVLAVLVAGAGVLLSMWVVWFVFVFLGKEGNFSLSKE